MSTTIFGLAPTDGVTFIQVALVVAAVSALASAVPTARAARQALTALRSE